MSTTQIPTYEGFLDESSVRRGAAHQEYLVCAAIVPPDDAAALREQLLPLRLKGQIKLHWSDEQESRRRKIVTSIAAMEPMTAMVTFLSQQQKKTERYRRKCLEGIYNELSLMGVSQVTCESRTPSQNKKDVAHLLSLRNSKKLPTNFDITHSRGGDDPLLWIPDIILGAVNAHRAGNDEHYEAIKHLLVYEARAEGSL